jgi:ribosome-associated protein
MSRADEPRRPGSVRGPLVLASGVRIPESELSIRYSRSGGPGGQNVNKVESKVTLRFRPESSSAFRDEDRQWLAHRLAGNLTRGGDLVLQASEHRERERNLAAARQRLAALLETALQRPRARRRTRAPASANLRRLEAKRRRSARKSARGGLGED